MGAFATANNTTAILMSQYETLQMSLKPAFQACFRVVGRCLASAERMKASRRADGTLGR
jgi:hypothetical protein